MSEKYFSGPSSPHVLVNAEGYHFVADSPELNTAIRERMAAVLQETASGAIHDFSIELPDMDSDRHVLIVEIPEAERLRFMMFRFEALSYGITAALKDLSLCPGELQFTGERVICTIRGERSAIAQGRYLAEKAAYAGLGRAARANTDGGGGAADEYANTEEPTFEGKVDSHIAMLESLVRRAKELREVKDSEFVRLPWMPGDGETNVIPFEESARDYFTALKMALMQGQEICDLAGLAKLEKEQEKEAEEGGVKL